MATLGGCAALGPGATPPLARIYGATPFGGNHEPGPPLIFIPGAFGTTLQDGRRERWPSSTLKLLFSRYEDLAMAIDANGQSASPEALRPSGVMREGLGFDFYGRLLDALTQIGGYELVAAGSPPPSKRRALYVYTHDWRRDNPSLTPGLEQLIAQIRLDHGAPKLRVDMLGHSNGGVLATSAGAGKIAAGLFTWGGDTYLIASEQTAVNDAFGNVDGRDLIIKVTGVTGTLDASDFI